MINLLEGGINLKNKILVIGITLLFLGMSFTTSIAVNNPIKPIDSGNTLYVGGTGEGNYTKIQDAIDNASDGDTVFVFKGTYYENIVVDESINLIGENRNKTIIDGGNISDTVCVNADLVKINEFTVQNSGKDYFCEGIEIHSDYTILLNNTITNNNYGITLCSSSSNNTIKGNNISNNYWPGIISWSSNDNNIINNIFSNNWYGISFWDSGNDNIISGNNISNNYRYGIYLYSSNNNTIINNSIISNNWSGMELIYSDGNNITGNNILNNGNEYEWRSGIRLHCSSRNNITENNIISNNGDGIGSAEYGFNNRIYHNNFINNRENAIDYDSNSWDDGYPSGGNYWDDYTGNDSNGDGIGDIPYDIYPYEEDRYPFMNLNGWKNHPPNTPTICGPSSGRAGKKYEFIFNAVEPDGDDVRYVIDWGDGTTYMIDFKPSGTDVKVNYTWEEKGNYIIKAKAFDTYGVGSERSEFEIEIPRTRATTNTMWYHWFLERFPLLEKLLNLLK